ncbi:MAG: hypothetical protein Q4Q25_04050 [Methanocorpusculum sp.]|nr:hypothetical protein [Lachnospiraceae bacterium]MDO5829306.1 hypothetical protein [Methanocorpusculum sp.]
MKCDEGVSEVLSLVLILGVVLTVSAIAAAVIIPGYAAEKEFQHQIILEDEFSSLKTGIDFLWLTETVDTEKPLLFSLSADHAASGKLEVGSVPLEITADEGVSSLELLEVTYAEDGEMQYRYLGGALYKGESLYLPASESPVHSVLICRESSAPFSLYAAEPIPAAVSLKRKAEYHNVSYGDDHTDVLTVYYFSVIGRII